MSATFNLRVRTTLFSILMLMLAIRSHAEAVRIERSYSWGSLYVSASRSEAMRLGGTSLLVFHTVLADFRLSDGQRLLIATGRIEMDPTTGDFSATDWPFFHSRRGNNDTRFTANNEVDSVQFRGGRLRFIRVPKTIIPEPAVIHLRRKQLARLEQRL